MLPSQVWLVAADCFFIGLAPVLVHMAKNADGKYSFHPVAINLMVECAKLTFATATLLVNVRSDCEQCWGCHMPRGGSIRSSHAALLSLLPLLLPLLTGDHDPLRTAAAQQLRSFG
jgi:hypothetical protein